MRLALAVLLAALCSCASNTTPIAYHCPMIELTDIPKLPLDKLNKKSKPDEVVKAYVSSVVLLKGWAKITKEQITQYNLSI